jgi:hypothetical protein
MAGDMFKADAIHLLGPDGTTEIATTKFWDRAGSPDYTSDVIKSPFGPALVAKTKGLLHANTEYTIRIHPAGFKDREGNSPVDRDGNPLADPTDFKFTTEAASERAANSYPGTSDPAEPGTIAHDDVVQVGFWNQVQLSPTGDSSAVKLTVVAAPAGLTGADFYVYGTLDDAMCGAAADVGFSIFPKLGLWPAGDYQLTYEATAVGGNSTVSGTLAFTADPNLNAGDDGFGVSDFPVPACATP